MNLKATQLPLLSIAWFLIGVMLPANLYGEAKRPNIILIFADDIGVSGVSSYGADRFHTPHIDEMAAKGLKFEHAFSAPICGPSRVQTLTGQYGFRTGAMGNGSATRTSPHQITTIAEVLRDAGYATSAVGKWSQLAFVDTERDRKAWGFDDYLIWTGSGAGGDQRYWNPTLQRNGESVTWPEDVYGPDVMHDHIVEFMKQKRDSGQPFFIYYPNPLPHSPRDPTPDSLPDANRRTIYEDQHSYLDKQVKQLIDDVEELGIAEDTLIIFTGDNGSVGGGTVNGRELIGGKGKCNEGGCRVPLIAYWKGVTPVGKITEDLVDFSDFFATFCELTDVPLPTGIMLDSVSFAPQIRGNEGQPREWIFAQIDRKDSNERFIRDANWTLTGDGRLFCSKEALFTEVPADPDDPEANAARNRLQAVLDDFVPAAKSRRRPAL